MAGLLQIQWVFSHVCIRCIHGHSDTLCQTHKSIYILKKKQSQLIFSYQLDIKEPRSITRRHACCHSGLQHWWGGGDGGVRGIHLKESEYTGVWGASFCALLHRAIMEWVIHPSGKCSIRRQTKSVPTCPAPTRTQTFEATMRKDNS